jgi:phenylalanyl-tRNA synthetase beta chain
MQIPLSWLRDFVEIDVPAEVLAEKLTTAGLETSLTYLGVPQQHIDGIRMPPSDHLVWDREKIKLGRILEVKPHPDADRLVMAMVDHGTEVEQCVTGAPNLFQYKGQGPLKEAVWTAIALEGAEVWDGHSETPKRMILKGKPLRGVFNKSMVCSEKELGIAEDHDGVILMHEDPGYPAGTPLQDVLGDVILTVELTPNLARCYSVLGVAREVAAILDKPLKQPKTDVKMSGPKVESKISIEIHNSELNPRFTAALLLGTEIKESPAWMQRRLKLIGQRPINNIVDVTNYVMFETGQPLHAFDYDKLVARAGGKTPTIVTRTPDKGESLLTLDGINRALAAEQILVCDRAGVIGLGGIMGGGDTEISDATTNVLLEAANWNFINIRRTMQAQKLFTEAGTRFSRGVHPEQAMVGVKRGIELMRELGGGEIAQGIVDEHPQPAPEIKIELKATEIKRLLGVAIPIEKAADVLTRLGFKITLRADSLTATVPDHRMDISGDPVIGQADLIEEVARIIGLDQLPLTLMDEALPEQWSNVPLDREEQARDALVALGLQENMTHRFDSPELEALLLPKGAEGRAGVNVPDDAGYVEIANPIQPDKSIMRHSLLPNLLAAARSNLRHTSRQGNFEIGPVYFRRPDQQLPDEPARLAIVMAGPRTVEHWTNGQPPLLDFYDLKGVVTGLMHALHVPKWSVEAVGGVFLHPGRSAKLLIDGAQAGSFGELHPNVARAFELPADKPFLVAEFDFDLLTKAVDPLHRTKGIPSTPPVYEDLALVVKESVPAGDVHAVIEQAGGALLRSVTLFDVYQGGSVPQGHKSLAFSLVYQADDRTLSDADVAAVRKKIIKAAQKQVEATLRA